MPRQPLECIQKQPVQEGWEDSEQQAIYYISLKLQRCLSVRRQCYPGSDSAEKARRGTALNGNGKGNAGTSMHADDAVLYQRSQGQPVEEGVDALPGPQALLIAHALYTL